MTSHSHLSFGAFLAPWHAPGQDPNLLLRRDLALAGVLDELNYDELWVGEHYSAGWAPIGSPELFLAAAARRTSRIRLATGVVPLPLHHPLMVADRALQLDHVSRGRFVLGVGAGSGVADMHMLGVDPEFSRQRVQESLEVLLPLLRGEVVTRSTDWFELHDALVQLSPFRGELEVAITSASSPFGMRTAGALGLGAVSNVAAPWGAARAGHGSGIDRLVQQWQHLVEAAEEAGRVPDRERWRLCVPMHVAESREAAINEVYAGWARDRSQLWAGTMGYPLATGDVASRKVFEASIENGELLIGSVDDCIAGVTRLQEVTGGFGTLLVALTDWATPARQRASLELLATYVVPRFQGSLGSLERSNTWVASNRDAFQGAQFAARAMASGPAR